MTRHRIGLLTVTFLLGLSQSAQAQGPIQTRTGLLEALVQCRAISDSAARLACFDASAAALDSAERDGDIVVVDREQVRAAQRQQFGFQIPSLDILNRGARPETFETLTSTMQSATSRGDGKWTFTLADGSVWRQTDTQTIRRPPRDGAETTVRRAAMGSFLMNFGAAAAVRVERIQ